MSKVLEEKDFISETRPIGGWRIWLGLALVALAFLLFVYGASWLSAKTHERVEKAPFLQVTNRQFSLFLWQNPEFMRANRKKKSGYLQGFHLQPKVTPKPEQAEQWVSSPPDILFLYHAWKRLLADERVARPVTAEEFLEFYNDAEEWQLQYWVEAPQGYHALIAELPDLRGLDVQDRLPDEVIRAYVGWRNYYYEGELINRASYTVEQIREFLISHPNYASSYWRHAYSDYLLSLNMPAETPIPQHEIPSFLKVALFNYYAKINPTFE
jgi:hypothetical protein